MTAIKVTDIKEFMNLLFSDTAFDSFSFFEGDIAVAIGYHLDGRVNMGFFSEEELEELRMEEFILWKDVKDQVRYLIKGRRQPVSLKIVLKKNGAGDISYILNIRYDSSSLVLVTGVSHAVFTTDRTGEKEWDDNMVSFLKSHNIGYEIL